VCQRKCVLVVSRWNSFTVEMLFAGKMSEGKIGKNP
jgi:hypothetical protein